MFGECAAVASSSQRYKNLAFLSSIMNPAKTRKTKTGRSKRTKQKAKARSARKRSVSGSVKKSGGLEPIQLLDFNAVVVTSKSGPVVNGCTVSWITRLSFDPPMVGIALANERFTRNVIVESGKFAVNILDKKDWEIAKYYGTVSGKKTDKSKKYPYEVTLHGNPVLKKAIAYLECEVVDRYQTGDHTFFVAEVVNQVNLRKGTPLTRQDLRKKGI